MTLVLILEPSFYLLSKKTALYCPFSCHHQLSKITVYLTSIVILGTALFIRSLSHLSLGALDIENMFLQTVVHSSDVYEGCISELLVNGERINLANYTYISGIQLGKL